MDTPTLLFLPILFMGLYSDIVNVSAKFAVRSCSRSWDNRDCSLGVGLRTPNLGESKAVGGLGWYCSKERL